MQNRKQTRPLALGLTALSALGRLLPHAPNVTPLGGACLFAGSRVGGVWAYLLPLAVMVATDPFVGAAAGGHSGYTLSSPVVYAAFLINVWLGRTLLRKATATRVGATAFLGSLQFFLLTNFAAWALDVTNHGAFYRPGLAGLMECYAFALPFWGRTLAGDLLFSGALFGAYALLSKRLAAETPTEAATA